MAPPQYLQVGNATIWETRRTSAEISELAHNLMKRTGRPILPELTDPELEGLVDFIAARLVECELQDPASQIVRNAVPDATRLRATIF